MNYLTNAKLLDDALSHISETVLINGNPQLAYITTAYLGMAENRHISSLQPFNRGDLVEHRGHTYLVTEEVKTKRHNKYRATMTSCNYYFTVRDLIGKELIGHDPNNGRPIYEDVYSEPYHLHGVMKEWDRKLDQAFSINMMEVAFFIDVQDNAKNREQFKVNNIYDIKGVNVKVTLHEKSNEGILGILFIKTGSTSPY
ncbi:hypothetical protein ACIQYS_01495 [Psychrobacillus sp. NPDC096426]|uniref:hypothetical protein n=1 Tax=Psychrobacillus sp. NPDC096426 TaxID=3364491 RepID=UPI003821C391